MTALSLPLAETRLRLAVEQHLAQRGIPVRPEVIAACVAECREFQRAVEAFRYEIPCIEKVPAEHRAQVEGSLRRHLMAVAVHLVDGYVQGAVMRLVIGREGRPAAMPFI